ncbi:MAG: T9SS type A sorting domain-containing protein [Bacteroidota bacterium]
MGNYSALPGQQIIVPVKINGFTDLGSMSLNILYDPTVLAYTGNSSWDTTLNGGFYMTNGGNGQFGIGWFSMVPVSIADTAIVGTIEFNYIAGNSALVFDLWSPGACEFSDEFGSTVYAQYINGSVTGGGPSPSCSNSFSIATGPTLSISVVASVVNSSPVYNYAWDFGDGTTASGPSMGVNHTYTTYGTYNISLTTWGYNLCVASSSLPVTLTSCNMYGTVFAHNTLCLDTGMVQFYQYDTLTSNYNLYDSVSFANHYFQPGYTQGVYLLKVIPGSTSASLSICVPTYYGDTPFWNMAPVINPCQTLSPYNIHMTQIIGTSPGPGNIGGTISTLLKQTNAGIPAEGIEILLTSLSDSILAVYYSDNTGGFHFNNLAYGTYKLRAEITSVHCTPIIITLSPSNPSDTNLILNVTPAGIILGLSSNTTHLPFTIGKIFPNPASDRLSIEVTGAALINYSIEVYNLLGQTVISQENLQTGGNNLISLNTEGLMPGIYLLSFKTAHGEVLRRSFSICR